MDCTQAQRTRLDHNALCIIYDSDRKLRLEFQPSVIAIKVNGELYTGSV